MKTPASSPSNRRASRRKGLRQPCTLVLPDGSVRQGTSADVGVDGLSLHCARPISPGTACRVSFDLPLHDRQVSIKGGLKVVYSSYSGAAGFKIGAMFTDLDEPSAEALREFSGPGGQPMPS
ncbi:MAG: PilZ domain-containing protein [Pseudomonadota bacterium]